MFDNLWNEESNTSAFMIVQQSALFLRFDNLSPPDIWTLVLVCKDLHGGLKDLCWPNLILTKCSTWKLSQKHCQTLLTCLAIHLARVQSDHIKCDPGPITKCWNQKHEAVRPRWVIYVWEHILENEVITIFNGNGQATFKEKERRTMFTYFTELNSH